MCEQNENSKSYFDKRTLPDPALKGYWEDIVIDRRTKMGLLNYCLWSPGLSLLSHTRCALYRFVLLQGPPGTGKTSLALGVANRVAEATHAKTGKRTRLLELSMRMIFSELLGQTVKSVSEAFVGIRMAARHGPVTVLLDEVEAVTVERASLGIGDPSEVSRSVDEVLRGIDSLRECQNVLILSTSNFPARIDEAVWSRVDVDFHIEMPGREIARLILEKSGQELQKLKVNVTPQFLGAVVNTLYDGQPSSPLSGRDLSKLLALTMALRGRRRVTVSDVCKVAEMLMKHNRRRHKNGNGQEETGNRIQRKV